MQCEKPTQCLYKRKRWMTTNTAWKVCKCGVFFGPYFSVFGLNMGKYGPEKTPYLDTFHTANWPYSQRFSTSSLDKLQLLFGLFPCPSSRSSIAFPSRTDGDVENSLWVSREYLYPHSLRYLSRQALNSSKWIRFIVLNIAITNFSIKLLQDNIQSFMGKLLNASFFAFNTRPLQINAYQLFVPFSVLVFFDLLTSSGISSFVQLTNLSIFVK